MIPDRKRSRLRRELTQLEAKPLAAPRTYMGASVLPCAFVVVLVCVLPSSWHAGSEWGPKRHVSIGQLAAGFLLIDGAQSVVAKRRAAWRQYRPLLADAPQQRGVEVAAELFDIRNAMSVHVLPTLTGSPVLARTSPVISSCQSLSCNSSRLSPTTEDAERAPAVR